MKSYQYIHKHCDIVKIGDRKVTLFSGSYIDQRQIALVLKHKKVYLLSGDALGNFASWFMMRFKDHKNLVLAGIPDFHAPPKFLMNDLAYDIMDDFSKKRSVAIGCSGGHGRTGLVAAVLIGMVEQIKNPIEVLRERYCHRAVESVEQGVFVHQYLGIRKPRHKMFAMRSWRDYDNYI